MRKIERLEEPMAPIHKKKVQFLRNFLVAKMIISNGHRPGAVVSLNMSNYHEMKPVPRRKGFHYMFNLNHKTIRSHGPAVIILNNEMKSMLDAYVKQRLPPDTPTVADKHAPLFVARNEKIKPVVSRARRVILRVVTEFLNKRCLRRKPYEMKVTFTHARKHIVTQGILNEHMKTSNRLAKHMMHSTNVQRDYYKLDKLDENVDVFSSICRFLKKKKKGKRKSKSKNKSTKNKKKNKTKNKKENKIKKNPKKKRPLKKTKTN